MSRDLSTAVEIIKAFEGIMDGNPKTVNLDPYLCPAGYWTIGWGHVVLGPSGEMLKGSESKKAAYAVYPNGITLVEAGVLLASDIEKFAEGVEKYVKVEISDTKFCALVSLAFNIGLGAFKNSTLLKVLNSNLLTKVPEQIAKWNKIKGIVSSGLDRRRKAEIALWNKNI